MKRYDFYTTKEISPRGWLYRQLVIQANGLSGHLDKVWRDVRDSKWIGGDAEGWERVPYWLDGFIPLAYLLQDADMIARAKRYIDAILLGQQQDGWICPCSKEERKTYDTWAVILLCKTLTVYYDCSGDERIPDVIYRAMRNYYELLESGEIEMFGWGKYRWFEAFVSLHFLYGHYKEEWIKALAAILARQGVNYNLLLELWKTPKEDWGLDTHIVNIAMSLKSEAISYELLDSWYHDAVERHMTVLRDFNGTPVGLFTGDECLGGLDPTRGTETCAVVEQMYSYEWLYARTGSGKWLERLELLAFNALPAALDDEMWGHQYDQMSNQIACIRFPEGSSHFGTNDFDAHLFGLEPHYGCCTANFNQGWPKLALAAFMHRENEIVNTVTIPAALDCDLAQIELQTDYPFENSFIYRIKAKEDFRFTIHVPSFAQNLKWDGDRVWEENGYLHLHFSKGEQKTFQLSYETVPQFVHRPYDLQTVQCGSLVFSLPIAYERRMLEYEKNGVERKFPYCDYEYHPKSDWQFAFASDKLRVVRGKPDGIPFSSHQPAVKVMAKVVPIDWGYDDTFDTVCAKQPHDRKAIGEVQEVALYPYGCAKLRMTELPKIK